MTVSQKQAPVTAPRDPAPHDLDLVIDFVNTLDVESGVDQLATPDVLAAWLAGRGLLARSRPVKRDELALAVGLREALRAAMLANNGGPADDAAWRRLETAAREGQLEVQFDAPGSMRLSPRAPGLTGALAGLLVPVANAIDDGSWQRVKACRAPTCQWAFYDRSRNRSGTWCEMAVCGNRTKVRAYRERSPRPARTARPKGT
jgi:predicted RNA-binding Zn ribbon-like protein